MTSCSGGDESLDVIYPCSNLLFHEDVVIMGCRHTRNIRNRSNNMMTSASFFLDDDDKQEQLMLLHIDDIIDQENYCCCEQRTWSGGNPPPVRVKPRLKPRWNTGDNLEDFW